jgi:hypothetical protein
VATLLSACIIGPSSGTTFNSSTVGQQLSYWGYSNQPNQEVDFFVMEDPSKDPTDDTNWTFLTKTFSSGSGQTLAGDNQTIYYWSLNITPVPDQAHLKRWPQGGIFRLRASLGIGGYKLNVFPENDPVTGQSCVGNNISNGAIAIINNCSLGNTGAVVSTTPSPVDVNPTPQYLTSPAPPAATDALNAANANHYYSVIHAPADLPSFKTKFQFGTGGDEVSAVYFNNGDLGIGRRMTCRSYSIPGQVGRACFVSNYAPKDPSDPTGKKVLFNQQAAAMDLAVNHPDQMFATVAMVYVQQASADNKVQFMVYGPGLSGALATKAVLDSKGVNTAVPNNCLACHAGGGSFNATTGVVDGAHFLPFDMDTFRDNGNPTVASQSEQFRKLNLHAVLTETTAAIADLVNGWYGGQASVAGTPFNGQYIPAGWTTLTAADQKAGLISTNQTSTFYSRVIKTSCRTCHIAQENHDPVNALDWTNYQQAFATWGPTMVGDVCGQKRMPHAEQTQRNAWNSSMRAHLLTLLGQPGACAPQ